MIRSMIHCDFLAHSAFKPYPLPPRARDAATAERRDQIPCKDFEQSQYQKVSQVPGCAVEC